MEPGLDVVEPTDLGLGGEDEVLEDEQPGEVVVDLTVVLRARGGVALLAHHLLLEAGEVVQVLERRGALGLGDGLHVDAGDRHGEGELDRQLVARRGVAVDGRGPPGADLGAARVRESVGDTALTIGVTLPGGFDEAVTLEPVERRVDLPDVERPRAAGALLELDPQLGAIHRALREEGHEPLLDRHACLLRL